MCLKRQNQSLSLAHLLQMMLLWEDTAIVCSACLTTKHLFYSVIGLSKTLYSVLCGTMRNLSSYGVQFQSQSASPALANKLP